MLLEKKQKEETEKEVVEHKFELKRMKTKFKEEL